jgi:hypothetical protein
MLHLIEEPLNEMELMMDRPPSTSMADMRDFTCGQIDRGAFHKSRLIGTV